MASKAPGSAEAETLPTRWAKVIDHTRCIGCHACTTACKSENDVPLGVTRTYVKYADVGTFPSTRRAFQVTRCNQCDDAPCTTACPTGAMFRRPDGIVDFDKSICIGCKACIAACPYDAIFINPEDHSAEKCNFCAHRIDVGLEPACVTVCPTEAIFVGDLDDPDSKVANVVGRDPVTVRRPEKETRPKLFYKGAHQATLDPLAAVQPDGGLYMWSEQGRGAHEIGAGQPADYAARHFDAANSSAAAVLSYDVSHKAPWDWRVSLYTLTKGISAGVYLAALLLCLLGDLIGGGSLGGPAGSGSAAGSGWESQVWLTLGPLLGLGALAVTGALLIWDLEHPMRAHLIFLRPRFRSWLVRGAFIITGYGVGLVAHLGASVLGWVDVARLLAWFVGPLALGTAVYTAYLFAQAKARDLWQNPLLPPHFAVQALLAGSATLMFLPTLATNPILTLLVVCAAVAHLLLVVGEVTLTHPTAHAALAVHHLVRGRYARWFWMGNVLVTAAVLLLVVPLEGAWIAPLVAIVTLAGLLAYEHAYVQAGQAVPLA